jgi:hypothetical protein
MPTWLAVGQFSLTFARIARRTLQMSSPIALSVPVMTEAPESAARKVLEPRSGAAPAGGDQNDLATARQDVDADEAGLELNPMWIVALGLGCFFAAAALILAFG